MSLILTFLGKGGGGRTTVAIAAARQLADRAMRVLLIGHDPSPAWAIALGVSPSDSVTEMSPNLSIVQLQSTRLLEKSWEEVKDLEKQYLRSPTLKNVYGQELGILPGMDQALALNAIREYNKSGKYDVIVYDGTGDLNTLRMLGIPEVGGWYVRRFRQVFSDSDIGSILSPFVQPIAGALLSVSWNPDDLTKNTEGNILDEGRSALADPTRVIAYLVTNDDPIAIATTKYLWGGAQQIGLNVGGVIFNRSGATEDFSPLPVSVFPELPNFLEAPAPPKPLIIDTVARQVKVFLPGFDKKQVKLTQSGPELTIEAGDQRRNIDVPPPLAGQSVKGAKFQEGYLIISF
jgi:arsenite-transporting ATPase